MCLGPGAPSLRGPASAVDLWHLALIAGRVVGEAFIGEDTIHFQEEGGGCLAALGGVVAKEMFLLLAVKE